MEKYKEYISAEITLFWVAQSEDSRGTLILAITELIPRNQLPSNLLGGGNSKYLYCSISNNPKKHIYCRRFFCSVDEAISCFEKHDWSSIHDGPDLDICSSFKREPTNGAAVVLPKGHIPLGRLENNLSMLLPNRPTSFRAYSFLDKKGETEKSYSASEIRAICKFVNKYCSIDLQIYNEFIGSTILCMQNPKIWGLHARVDEDEKIYRFLLLPRDNEYIESMYVTIRSVHSYGALCSELKRIDSEVFELPIPIGIEDPELYLWDDRGELLEVRPIKFFGSKLWTSTQHRLLPNGKMVPVWTDDYYLNQNEEPNVMENAEKRRLYEMLEKRKEFCYFGAGEQQKAKNIVGSILASAGLSIVICDPYLDQKGINNYISGWVRCKELILFVSNQWLKKNTINGSTNQAEIENCINNIVTSGAIKAAKLYGLPGTNNGFVHDRFIAIENRDVWCLGSSLNNFGDKDTVLIKPPTSKAIIDRINAWTTGKAILLQEWK